MSDDRREMQKTVSEKRPHANMLRAGPIHIACERQSTRMHVRRMRTPGWLSAHVVMGVVVLRSVSFVMTPPAISIPVSKEVTSKNSRFCTCKDASPERMTTKMNSASHKRTRGAEWRSSGSSRSSEKPNCLPHESQRR